MEVVIVFSSLLRHMSESASQTGKKCRAGLYLEGCVVCYWWMSCE